MRQRRRMSRFQDLGIGRWQRLVFRQRLQSISPQSLLVASPQRGFGVFIGWKRDFHDSRWVICELPQLLRIKVQLINASFIREDSLAPNLHVVRGLRIAVSVERDQITKRSLRRFIATENALRRDGSQPAAQL